MNQLLILFLVIIPFVLNAQNKNYNEYSSDSIVFELKSLGESDTLKLMGVINDGGEFCKHKEWIYIYKYENAYYAKLLREKPCNSEIRLKDGSSLFVNKTKLNSDLISAIYTYINDFRNFPVSFSGESNAPTFFTFEYQKKFFYRNDPMGTWKSFIELRNKLFCKI